MRNRNNTGRKTDEKVIWRDKLRLSQKLMSETKPQMQKEDKYQKIYTEGISYLKCKKIKDKGKSWEKPEEGKKTSPIDKQR